MSEMVKIGAGDAIATQSDEQYDGGCSADAHYWEEDRPDADDLCECKEWTWGAWQARRRR